MKPIITLKLNWETALKKLLVPHFRTCTCGCKNARKEFSHRVRELDKMIKSGEAVVE